MGTRCNGNGNSIGEAKTDNHEIYFTKIGYFHNIRIYLKLFDIFCEIEHENFSILIAVNISMKFISIKKSYRNLKLKFFKQLYEYGFIVVNVNIIIENVSGNTI